jgi:hypothetical protein
MTCLSRAKAVPLSEVGLVCDSLALRIASFVSEEILFFSPVVISGTVGVTSKLKELRLSSLLFISAAEFDQFLC